MLNGITRARRNWKSRRLRRGVARSEVATCRKRSGDKESWWGEAPDVVNGNIRYANLRSTLTTANMVQLQDANTHHKHVSKAKVARSHKSLIRESEVGKEGDGGYITGDVSDKPSPLIS